MVVIPLTEEAAVIPANVFADFWVISISFPRFSRKLWSLSSRVELQMLSSP